MRPRRSWAIVLGAAAGVFGMMAAARGHLVSAAEVPVSYNGQIAPVLYAHCTSCHHEGGSGPFSLMHYSDAKRFGTVMEQATGSRYMPPWLPSGPHGMFADDRRLTTEEIALIRRWVNTGMAEGAVNAALKVPDYTSGWQLGAPDLVLEMEKAVEVPASGTDLFRNFILPAEVGKTEWVRAMEIKPGSANVVHHANLAIDRTASLRRAHPADWKDGIPGMDVMVDAGESFDPDSHFLYWKPDSTALVEAPGLPWRLDPGDDLVLNMHLKPTGKVETVKAEVGLYFAKAPASRFPMLLQLENDGKLDIPAGDADFKVEDELKLPEDVDLLAIYPHAHYLGKRLEGWAELPDGTRESLILIENWDIDRQAVYRYAKPMFLPAGTVVHMRYSYDNSAGNPHNPNTPPIRVTDGNRSVDEMGHLWLQVLPRTRPGGPQDMRAPLLRAWMENRLRKDPREPIALFNLGSLDLDGGRYEEAAGLFERALATRPNDPRTMTALASALDKAGRWEDASTELKQVFVADPSYVDAHFDLAVIDLQHGDYAGSEEQLRVVLAAHPGDPHARATLGGVLLATGHAADAKAEFERALAEDAGEFDALYNLSLIELERGEVTGAIEHLTRAEVVNPRDPDVHRTLASAYAGRGELEAAIREQKAAISAGPAQAELWKELAEMHRRSGETKAADDDLQHAASLEASAGSGGPSR